MKRLICSLLILIGSTLISPAQHIESLVDNAVARLEQSFQGRYQVPAAVAALENESDLSDLAVQRIYQLLAARLEKLPALNYIDAMVQFSGKRGEFNRKSLERVDFLISLRLLRRENAVGLGISVFSRRTDQVISVHYVEAEIGPAEAAVLAVRETAFREAGFSPLLELAMRPGLLDVASLVFPDNTEQCVFFYPEQLEFYTLNGGQPEPAGVVKLEWPGAYYPTLQPEGKILVLQRQNVPYLTVGSNFATESILLTRREGSWQVMGGLPFTPLTAVTVNGAEYLVGARYAEGRNFFKGRLLLLPMQGEEWNGGTPLEKSVPEFFQAAFACRGAEWSALHLIDRTYHWQTTTPDGEEVFRDNARAGSTVAVSGERWLAHSDFSQGRDRLFLVDIADGGRRPLYENALDAEVLFIHAGRGNGVDGFWVALRAADGRCTLQFWGKKE